MDEYTWRDHAGQILVCILFWLCLFTIAVCLYDAESAVERYYLQYIIEIEPGQWVQALEELPYSEWRYGVPTAYMIGDTFVEVVQLAEDLYAMPEMPIKTK